MRNYEKIGIIGGGPAGLMAAITAKSCENEVTILETNSSISKKLRITGGGRCNITNACFYDEFLDNVIQNSKFIYSAFNKFDNYTLMDYFRNAGVDLIIEDDGRVFPKSEDSNEIIEFFSKKIVKLGINVETNTKVVGIESKDKFLVISQNGRQFEFDILIIATGGKSYPKTGSDGFGYMLAKKLGHKIVEPMPCLVPIFIKDNLSIRALSFKDIKLKFETNRHHSIIGDLMINKNFITGPAVLKSSSLIRGNEVKNITVDFFKDKTYNELDNIIINAIKENPKKTVINVLRMLINEKLLEVIFNRLKLDKNLRVSELNKETRGIIIENLKNFTLSIDKLGGFESAIVTRGGVELSQINPSNMMSKIISNLFFVGEILDVDSLTGGFNLQIYLSMAYACGTYIKENL